jgi:hypothetical protein
MVMTTESVNVVDEMDMRSEEIDLASAEDISLKYDSQNRYITVRKSMVVRITLLSTLGVTLLLAFYSVNTLRAGTLLRDNGFKSTSLRRSEAQPANASVMEPTSDKRSISNDNEQFNEFYSDDALRNDKTVLTRFMKWKANHPQSFETTNNNNNNKDEDGDFDFDFSRYFSDDALRNDQDHTLSRFMAWQKEQENKKKFQELSAIIETGRS